VQNDVRRAILVPLDGSMLAEGALIPARQLAHASGDTILLIRVVAHHDPDGHARLEQEIEEAQRYLANVASRVRARGPDRDRVAILTQCCAGDPADRIVREAELWRTDMIVMSTHGRGGLGRLLHGSVASAVLHSSSIPVLLVPARAGARPTLAGDAVLAPVDGSAFAEVALGRAAEMARGLAMPLVILFATHYEPLPVEGLAPTMDEVDRLVENGRAYVDGLAAQVRRAGVDARGELASGVPGRGILACAERCNAAAIVMATHGRSGLSRLALGSVAGEVLEHTRRPLLLMRPPATATAVTAPTTSTAGLGAGRAGPPPPPRAGGGGGGGPPRRGGRGELAD
jgi:nucleotide-binding universal stress UspA family protein